MKFLSTWLRNMSPDKEVCLNPSILNEVPEHMAQEYRGRRSRRCFCRFLNEVPEHMAQEYDTAMPGAVGNSSPQ